MAMNAKLKSDEKSYTNKKKLTGKISMYVKYLCADSGNFKQT